MYRSASVRCANRDDFRTGLGATFAGARWNSADSFATIYIKRPALVSITNAVFWEVGWHIAPAVDADNQNLTLL